MSLVSKEQGTQAVQTYTGKTQLMKIRMYELLVLACPVNTLDENYKMKSSLTVKIECL